MAAILFRGPKDGSIKLWDFATGQTIHILSDNTTSVSSLTISPDACLVISGGEDGFVRLWELDWQYDFLEAADWYAGATPHAMSFLRAHSPSVSGDISEASWDEDDLAIFIRQLEDLGYGWLRTDGVKARLMWLAGIRQ